MKIRVVREPSVDGATLGCMFLDGHFFCFTLEDEIRERTGAPVASWKVAGATAIPAGNYRVIVTPSARFGRPLPLLVDIPGFAGVRIHPGNVIGDTSGCVLVGQDRADGRLRNSRVACDRLFEQLHVATGEIWISIENPLESQSPSTAGAESRETAPRA